MEKPFVSELFIGKVKEVGTPGAKHPMDRPWRSGIFKSAAEGPIWLSRTGMIGDEVADTVNHGGLEKAVFAYPIKHYTHWKEDLGLDNFAPGAMGENMAMLHMDETNVCIGDIYQWGEAILQVSQPRRPCWKPARRLRVIDLALRTQNTGRTGWYFRVLQEGNVQSGVTLSLLKRPAPEWSVAACNDVMNTDVDNLPRAAALASCEWLAESWKVTLNKRLDGKPSSSEERVYGPNKAREH